MFGEQKQATQVNVQVNYAEKLEEARSRAVQRSPSQPAALSRDFVEAAFKDVDPEAVDTSWLDEKDPAADTTWLET